jgi:hypothetical protein
MYVKISSNSHLLLNTNVYSILSHNLLLYDINEKIFLNFFPRVGLVRKFGDDPKKKTDWENKLILYFYMLDRLLAGHIGRAVSGLSPAEVVSSNHTRNMDVSLL